MKRVMNVRLLQLLLLCGMGAGNVSVAHAQTKVSSYADNPDHYADINGDGVKEHLESGVRRPVYDCPEGAWIVPRSNGDRAVDYYLPAEATDYLKIVDGAYYMKFHMIKVAIFKDGSMMPYEEGMEDDPEYVGTKLVYEGEFSAMGIKYPEGREPDFKEGMDWWFRIASEEDMVEWLMHGVSSFSSPYLFRNGTVWSYRGEVYPSGYDTRLAWVDFDGNVVEFVDGTDDWGIADIVADLNADGKPDILLRQDCEEWGYNKYAVAMSSPGGYAVRSVETLPTYYSDGLMRVADFNRDGRQDIFVWERVLSTDGDYLPVTLLQLADGSFVRKPLTVVTDEEEIEGAAFSSGGNGSFHVSYTNFSGMCGGKGSESSAPIVSAEVETVDINLDGYPDLIDGAGRSFLSLPDGRYYAATFAGSLSHADLNGDGIADLVVFDSPNKQVLLGMSNGVGFDMTQLIENGNISAMYCRDLDGDGRPDILLCMDAKKNEEYAYLAFFHNMGDGTFKRTVRPVQGSYIFSRPVDFNSNGRPSLVAVNNEWCDYRCQRIDWDSKFVLTQTPLFPGPQDCPIGWNGNYIMEFMDYDGNGQPEILANLYNADGQPRGTFLYASGASAPNTAPERMEAPRVIADRSNGLLKIEWSEGTDKETRTCDLAYEVRVSHGHTNVLLRRERGTQLIANAGAWPTGALAVSVRATDGNGMHGPWSEAAAFSNDVPGALFVMDHASMSTVDTLCLKAVGGADISYEGWPDGKVETLDNGQTILTFPSPGQKTVRATVPGGVPHTERIDVAPVKPVGKYETYGSSFDWGFDFDQCGAIECEAAKGIYVFAEGKYSFYPSFSLSDATVNTLGYLDFNMDGLPDMLGDYTKNGHRYLLFLNEGDLEFEAHSPGYTDADTGRPWTWNYLTHAGDFNNDGLTDYVYNDRLYLAKADGTVEYWPLPTVDGWQPMYGTCVVEDFDRNGTLDLLMGYYNSAYRSPECYSTFLLLNDGNACFEPRTVFERRQVYVNRVTDVDGDGYPDIVTAENLGNGRLKYTAYSAGKELRQWQPMELPGRPLMMDVDNDGLCDYVLDDGNNGTLELSSHGRVKTVLPWGVDDNYTTDINQDGRPDAGQQLMLSRYDNTAPTAPTHVYANMAGNRVAVCWSGASDAETPAGRLRYNVSIRRKGSRGPGSYVVSPLNATCSEAATAPTLLTTHYRYGTRMDIPMERFEEGQTYEICVQAIDPWNAHSPFSGVTEFKPGAAAIISMAQRGGVGLPVPISIEDNSGEKPVIEADGGGLVEGNTIVWSTPGLKTVTVTAGKAKAEHTILIVDRPMLRVVLPEQMLTGVPHEVELPEALLLGEGVKARVWADEGLDVQVDATANTALLTPLTDGPHTLHVTYADDIFSKPVDEYADTRSLGAGFRPSLTMVGVDAATGRNLLTWDASMELPGNGVFTGKVAIYRETDMAGNFELLAMCPLADGAFVDEGSRPDVQSHRYTIALPTVYGTESRTGTVHGSIHLMLNRGMGNDINLHWTPYEGADIDQYTIMCGTSPTSLQPLATVSGNARSFTHKRTSSATTFYSIAYKPAATARAAAHGGQADGQGTASNVMSSEEAYEVTMVKDIILGTREESYVLGEDCKQLHLTARVMPAVATIGNVEWSMVQGHELATLEADGTLSVCTNATGGTVTICARATDGSGVTATMDITVQPTTVGIGDEVSAEGHEPIIRVEGRTLTVETCGESVDIAVHAINGHLVHRSVANGKVGIGLRPGIYVVKAGRSVRKLCVQ